MVKRSQVELWAREVLQAFQKNNKIEDASVELKTTWIEPEKAARRLAGHANAAGLEPILWLIGVDEDNGIVGANPMELANWIGQVESCFDGNILPNLTPVRVPIEINENTVSVMALYFETDQPPYVIKNSSGGRISREVPWRGGTRLDSATRDNLLRMLIPLQRTPSLEIFKGYLSAHIDLTSRPNRLNWELQIEGYLIPKSKDAIIIPFHHCRGQVRIQEEEQSIKLQMYPFSKSITMARTDSEIVIDGPGSIKISSFYTTLISSVDINSIAEINLEISPIDSIQPVNITIYLKPYKTSSPKYRGYWHLSPIDISDTTEKLFF